MVVELNSTLSFAARYSAPPFVLAHYQPEMRTSQGNQPTEQ
jgi:hypothetical protein